MTNAASRSTDASNAQSTRPIDRNQPPITQSVEQSKKTARSRSAWIRELPKWSGLPESKEDFRLVDKDRLGSLFVEWKTSPEVKQRILDDLQILDEVMKTSFAERDRRSKVAQNGYRSSQIIFIVLALSATILGSLQALLLGLWPSWLPYIAAVETLLALYTGFRALRYTTDAPMSVWINERKITERMRQEFFSFLMYQAPYDESVPPVRRANLLNERTGNILAGRLPTGEADAVSS